MGSPLKAAENAASSYIRGCQDSCFNGAAAKSSGKWPPANWSEMIENRFNGAAAKSSGKYVLTAFFALKRFEASMGPPLKAAENSPTVSAWGFSSSELQWGRR